MPPAASLEHINHDLLARLTDKMERLELLKEASD